jgi:hypothetical protein
MDKLELKNYLHACKERVLWSQRQPVDSRDCVASIQKALEHLLNAVIILAEVELEKRDYRR